MINTLIVDDSVIVKHCIEEELKASGLFNIVASIESAANAQIVALRGDIDLILMDVCTAEYESGLKAAAKIKKDFPNIKIVIITSMPEYSFLEKAKSSGCDGFWYKNNSDLGIVDICLFTMKGKKYFPECTPVIKIGNILSSDFTEREYDIIEALILGKKYSEISEELLISENTVKYHIKNLLSKTGFGNSIQLVAEIVEKGLIMPRY